MKENPYFWLRRFALCNLSAYLLEEPQKIFEAAANGCGNQQLFSLAEQYASSCKKQLPAPKFIQLDYTGAFEGLEALFLNVFPCPQLSSPPVHLAAVRLAGSAFSRVFRLHYPTPGNLYISEIHLEEKKPGAAVLPSYNKAISLIFSFTLGIPYQADPSKIKVLSPGPEEQDHFLNQRKEVGNL